MSKKSDRDSDEGAMPTDDVYTLEDVFRRGFKTENYAKHSKIVKTLIERLSDNCDYMKRILCMVAAMEILKPNGFSIYIKEKQQKGEPKDAYYSKMHDRIVLFESENINNIYIALIDQLIYKVFTTIKLSSSEEKDIMNLLDTIKETTKILYEELTQIEIKMLEWLDIKLMNFINVLSSDNDEYVTDLRYMDESVINLVEVCLLWGRSLERLEVVSKVLSPLTEYIQNTILIKIENFIINNQLFKKIQISDYFKMKLNTIKILNEKDLPYEKKFKILTDVRALDVPIQTQKTLNEFKLYIDKIDCVDEILKEFEKEKSIYRYCKEQRSDEINYIEKRKKELSNKKKINEETLMQLSNLKDVIEREEQVLEESLKIIDEKINLLKGAMT